ncbi:MAG: alpha-(1-_3)-arabinofuranosyltransferase family protein [Aeromicrobium sp.]|uniref:alpha-(1->3)-arabinofuranosyltransferase domain-containing protein n=1 Tax=Aeromicrobium sp. TaxID=1871063 RepID=UPI0039E5F714
MPGPRSAEPVSALRRFRLAVGCLVLTALAFVQQPGRTLADTKLDLVVDPGGFLQRALTMWDATGFGGQVQNQAYGYLFPMGPFFGIGHLLDLEPWVIQRLWWALLWSVAFVGAAQVCRALGIGSPRLHLLAGFLYALSPRVLTIMGVNSIEAWPASLAPWVLLPLVFGAGGDRPRLRAAQSAVAVGCVGGVNAVATAAVLPLATLWLLTAPPGPARRTLLRWWPPLVLVMTAWWWGPLVLLGRYSPPFLDRIESSATTTASATVFDALRGTSNWVPRSTWTYEAGRDLLTWPVVAVALTFVAAVGLAGLARRDMPHRRFVVRGLLAGIVLTTLGHTAGVAGWVAPAVQDLLDGPLAPMRNIHKFDPVVRLPLVLGLVHALSVAAGRIGDLDDAVARRWWTRGAGLVTLTMVGLAVTPLWAARIAGPGGYAEIPPYWVQAAEWLGDRPEATTLVTPASRFGDYLWGSTGDEVLQPLASSAWTARPVVPLTPDGTVRLLDTLGDVLASGRAETGLATTLDRAGIDRVLLRFDLALAADPTRAEAAWQTLRSSPGMDLAASFGPLIGGPSSLDIDGVRTFVDDGWRTRHPAIAVFEVHRDELRTVSAPVDEVPVIVGGADTVAALDGLGLVEPGPTLLYGDRIEGATGPLTLTDGLRRGEVDFAQVDRNRSASLSAGEPYAADRAAHDFLTEADEASLAIPELIGAESLTASSSRAWVNGWGPVSPSALPWSAFDGEPRTAWQVVGPEGSIELDLGAARALGQVSLRAGLPPGMTQQVTVHTSTGEVHRTLRGDETAVIAVGTVDRLRIEVSRAGGDARLSEVASDALEVSRPLTLPAVAHADQIVVGLDGGERPSCLDIAGAAHCRSGAAEPGEDAYAIDRRLDLQRSGGMYAPAVTTVAVAGDALDALLQTGSPMQVRASSTLSDDPRTGTSRMIDSRPETGWIAQSGDTAPTVSVSWSSPQTVSALRLTTADSLPASSVARVRATDDAGRTVEAVVHDGLAILPETTTSRLELELISALDAADADGVLPVGVSELQIDGTPQAALAGPTDEVRSWGCGTGPELVVDGVQVPTALVAAPLDLLDGQRVRAESCGATEVALPAGPSRLTVRASAVAQAGQLVLTETDAQVSDVASSSSSEGTLVTELHNVNPGWVGTVDGAAVPAVAVGGWQQGWVLPDDARPDDLSTRFAPAGTYRAMLVLGGIVAFLVAVLTAAVSLRQSTTASVGVATEAGSRWAARPVLVIASGVTLAVVGGAPGLLAGGVALILVSCGRRGRAVVAACVPLALAAGGLIVVRGSESLLLTPAAAQWCAVVSTAALVALVAEPRWPKRLAGRSTQR